MINIAIITISDTREEESDITGKKLVELFDNDKFFIDYYKIIKDEKSLIKRELLHCVDNLNLDIIITNGGTGFGSRDVTPEATKEVIEKEIPGLAELMRYEGSKKTKKAYLSRTVTGIRKKSIIINLPGSPKGATESLEAIIDLLSHSVAMINDAGH